MRRFGRSRPREPAARRYRQPYRQAIAAVLASLCTLSAADVFPQSSDQRTYVFPMRFTPLHDSGQWAGSIGLLVGRDIAPPLALEAEVDVFPGEGTSTEALFGATVGASSSSVGIFGKVRVGVVYFPGTACPMVYPPAPWCSDGTTVDQVVRAAMSGSGGARDICACLEASNGRPKLPSGNKT